jgi:hypothetical protein
MGRLWPPCVNSCPITLEVRVDEGHGDHSRRHEPIGGRKQTHPMYALGRIVPAPQRGLEVSEIASRFLDYWDHWETVDPRLASHSRTLSSLSEAFGGDLVNIATYSTEILRWLDPENIKLPESVVAVGGMTEAFLMSIRSAADLLGSGIAYVASDRRGSVPSSGLQSLLRWVAKNPARVTSSVLALLQRDMEWFWGLRSIRDHIAHGGSHANIHCDGRQFNLWIYSPRVGWVIREPLLPRLKRSLRGLLDFSNAAADSINERISMPSDRVGSRVVSGVMVHSIHKLMEIADDYAKASP